MPGAAHPDTGGLVAAAGLLVLGSGGGIRGGL